MTSYGKTIRIYLADGTPTGIRHAELVNWTGASTVVAPGTRTTVAAGRSPAVSASSTRRIHSSLRVRESTYSPTRMGDHASR